MLVISGIFLIVLGFYFLKKAGKEKTVVKNPLSEGYQEVTARIVDIEEKWDTVKHESKLKTQPYYETEICFQFPVYRFIYDGKETEYTDTARDIVPKSAVGSTLQIYVRRNPETDKFDVVTKETSRSNRILGILFFSVGIALIILELLATFL